MAFGAPRHLCPGLSNTVIDYVLAEDGDSFEGYPTSGAWAEGSAHDGWVVKFTSGGQVIPVDVSGDRALQLASASGISNGGNAGTGSTLVTTAASTSGDIEFRARMRTVSQLRSGYSPPGTPNAWEVAWLVWNYSEPVTNERRFYYLALKTSGFELGKVDQSIALPGGQRFLWTDSTPFSVGTWYVVDVKQVGARIQVLVDGVLRADFTDGAGSLGTPNWGTSGEVVMESGSVGLYHEDAQVQFSLVQISSLTVRP